jgi:general secretion pathway protein E
MKPLESVLPRSADPSAEESGERPARLERDLLKAALDRAGASGRPLMEVLEEALNLPSTEFIALLGRTLRYEVLANHTLAACTPDLACVPLAEALRRQCAAIRLPDGRAAGVLADPFDQPRLCWLDERLAGRPLFLAHPRDLAAFLACQEEHFEAIREVAAPAANETAPDSVEILNVTRLSDDTSLVVKLVNSTLYDALKARASDIHFETEAGGLRIQYRIDGVLNLISRMSGQDLAEQVISRLKVMAALDIAERRVPQDGRFKVEIRERQIDFRVSIMPSIFGEDAVLRILDKQDLADQVYGVRLDALGFSGEMLRALRRLVNAPYGMILVTGPTGSGKTTTLYAAITEINKGKDKIITIEDPVEYQLPGVLQIPVNEKKGLTFARGLRSILRHDPDKIMVGEIRDPETADIALQSALTGHLVLTTIHANNVFDVIGRLTQMKVDPYSQVSALNAVLAQRLVRLACPHCAVECRPSDELLSESGLSGKALDDFRFVEAPGCKECRDTGYRGRTAIAELLHFDDEIRQLIVERQPLPVIRDTARRGGLRQLRDVAVDLVRSGRTTLEEINRVTLVA